MADEIADIADQNTTESEAEAKEFDAIFEKDDDTTEMNLGGADEEEEESDSEPEDDDEGPDEEGPEDEEPEPEDGQEDDDQEPEDEKPEDEEPEPEPEPDNNNQDGDRQLTIDDINDMANYDFEFPDEMVKVGDMEVNLKEYEEDFPESAAAAKVIAFQVAELALDSMPSLGEIQALKQELATLKNDIFIGRKHDDYQDVINGDDYKDWLKKQSKVVRNMANSSDPTDVVSVLDEFKDFIGDTGDTRPNRKKKYDALHKNTVRSKVRPKRKSSAPKDPDAEFDEIFNKE